MILYVKQHFTKNSKIVFCRVNNLGQSTFHIKTCDNVAQIDKTSILNGQHLPLKRVLSSAETESNKSRRNESTIIIVMAQLLFASASIPFVFISHYRHWNSLCRLRPDSFRPDSGMRWKQTRVLSC